MKRIVYFIMIVAALFASCKKNDDPTSGNKVTITNEKVTNINPTSVVISGTYSYASNLDGIYGLVSANSDMANALAFESVLNGKDFAATVTELKENTKYYYKYRYVSMGGALESEAVKSFTTLKYGVPDVSTADVSEITGLSAKCGGTVTDDGYLEVTARGVCWSKTSNPTTECEHTTDGSGVGAFTSDITNLEPDTKYYVCAYATNSKGTGYGEVKQFTTMDGDSDIYTGAISDITVNSAVCKGSKVSEDGGLDIIDKGLCWAIHSDPTTDDTKVSKGAGLGEFTVDITGLEYGVKYYVRAYSVNTKETKYGNEREFTTMDGISVVTTSAMTNIMATTATCGGNVTSDGGLTVTERGICWSKYEDPTIEDMHKQSGTGTGTFAVNLDNLEMDETYHVRAYAKNSHTVSYGDDVVFTTLDGKPVMTTLDVTEIMETTAICGGCVTEDYGFAVTERGICWSTTPDPTTSDNCNTEGGQGTGTYYLDMAGLAGNTTYYVRSYAKNDNGIGYGEQKSFKTLYLNGHTFVDLGLPSGLLWATCNVGAENPEDYGDYFAWGETTTKSTYNWSTYKWCNGSYNTLTKYCTDGNYGTVDNKTELELADDAAHAKWGGDCRMPTYDELVELKNNCNWTWTTMGGKSGYRVSSKSDNNKYIFLPTAGFYNESSLNFAGSIGGGWSSSLYTSFSNSAFYLYFGSDGASLYYGSRYYGRSVRPVCPQQK